MVNRLLHNHLEYAVLPQWLDTETSGLLVVATLERFGSYLSKLLEQKTTSVLSATPPAPSFQQPQHHLTKRYRQGATDPGTVERAF
jgi:hypothetical protein